MNGAERVERVTNSFWLCERSKYAPEEELISREEIQWNMIESAVMNEPLRYLTENTRWTKITITAKKESIKKIIFRRFFPWRRNRK